MITTSNLPATADQIVSDFAKKICSIEPGFVEGIYIIGSLSMNDFYSNKSDIDFIVLCKTLPGEKIFDELRSIHKSIAKQYPKPDLSGCYLLSHSILIDPITNINTVIYHQGRFRKEIFEMAPISLAELKTNAITIVGDKAQNLPININRDVINKFLYNNINSYWREWVGKHSTYFKCKTFLVLFPRLTEWTVLGIARQMCTLQTGRIVSKTEAGFYCINQLPGKFHPILKNAIEIRKDNRTYPFLRSYAVVPSFRRAAETINCVNYMIREFNKDYNNKLK